MPKANGKQTDSGKKRKKNGDHQVFLDNSSVATRKGTQQAIGTSMKLAMVPYLPEQKPVHLGAKLQLCSDYDNDSDQAFLDKSSVFMRKGTQQAIGTSKKLAMVPYLPEQKPVHLGAKLQLCSDYDNDSDQASLDKSSVFMRKGTQQAIGTSKKLAMVPYLPEQKPVHLGAKLQLCSDYDNDSDQAFLDKSSVFMRKGTQQAIGTSMKLAMVPYLPEQKPVHLGAKLQLCSDYDNDSDQAFLDKSSVFMRKGTQQAIGTSKKLAMVPYLPEQKPVHLGAKLQLCSDYDNDSDQASLDKSSVSTRKGTQGATRTSKKLAVVPHQPEQKPVHLGAEPQVSSDDDNDSERTVSDDSETTAIPFAYEPGLGLSMIPQVVDVNLPEYSQQSQSQYESSEDHNVAAQADNQGVYNDEN
ncbi:hypothetical protein FRX31_029505 [Thalictrum thalictroides]|uniref:Uncharacterized protein n=1 Tax=Thalictrum thalictroides TaxID=46969 RepID=A0A7J6V812_THATH|nr:hypothetical protein FRX31_029505 [Thalictrum thalictroides]